METNSWSGEGTGHLQAGFEQFEISTPQAPLLFWIPGLPNPLWTPWDTICQVLLVPGCVRTRGWARVGLRVSTMALFPELTRFTRVPLCTSIPQQEKSPELLPKQMAPGKQRPKQLPEEQWQCPVSVAGCSQTILHKSHERRCCSLLPAGHRGAKHVHEILVRTPGPGQGAQNVLPSIIPFLPPQCTEAQAQQLELQVQQHLLSNVMCSKGWWRSTGAANLKCCPLCCQEAWSWFPCPQLPFIPTCLPDTCAAALPLCRSTELPGTACSLPELCQQGVLTPASWGHPPNEGK